LKAAPTRIAVGIVAAIAAGTLAVLGAATAAAAGTLDFGGGTAPGISDFAPIVLNGAPQLTSLSVTPFSVVDTTASGAGWHVTLTIPDLVNGGSTLFASALTMDVPVVTPSGGADPTNVVGHASTGHFGSGEAIVTAATGFGDGTYLVSPQPVILLVPVTARAGTYTSAATITVTSGP
jgi:hypothetical protein